MVFTAEIQTYTGKVVKAVETSPFGELGSVADAIMAARADGRWIFTAGNGGSAATASHFANDLVKGLSVPGSGKKRFRAKSLCDATPIMTALANDYEYGRVFTEQLENYASAGDVLVVFSGSGNSPNVVNAAKWAKEAGMTVISFGGRDGGKVKGYSDISCIAATDSMEEIEDVHLVWGHALVTAMRAVICEEK